MSCDVSRMAKKMNALRFDQMNWGHAEITNRRPTAEPAALFLMQIRSSRLRVAPLKKKLPVFMDVETRDVPCPVKIIQVV
jgi:hypothetical protein